MGIASVLFALTLQNATLGTTLTERIDASVKLLGADHQKLQDQLGRPTSVVEGNAVWVYGTWTPSPRKGFLVSFFRDDQGSEILENGVQFVAGSVPNLTTKTLTVDGTKAVPRDFDWTSGESTPTVFDHLKAVGVKYYAQKDNPTQILGIGEVSGHPVYIFSRQIKGDVIRSVFDPGSGEVRFDPQSLDAYCYAVGLCDLWHYTAGFTQDEIIGPGSYADKSLATSPWVELGK
jgi:hypothetical protein